MLDSLDMKFLLALAQVITSGPEYCGSAEQDASNCIDDRIAQETDARRLAPDEIHVDVGLYGGTTGDD